MNLPKNKKGPNHESPNRSHWWQDEPYRKFTRAGLSVDKAKCAMIYEGLRRRPEVAKAWCAQTCDPTWQAMTRLALTLLPWNWAQLEDEHRAALLNAMYDHRFIPPLGYSCAPKDSVEAKRRAALKHLPPPPPSDLLGCGEWVRQLQELARHGFVIVAVDRKSNEATRHAADALGEMPRKFREADLEREVTYDNAAADFEAAAEKLTEECALTGKVEGVTTARIKVRVLGKHKDETSGAWREDKLFVFESVAEEIARFDDQGEPSDFISRIRL